MNDDTAYSAARRARGTSRPTPDLVIIHEPWMDGALCAQVDMDIFYPEKGGTTRPAKAICARCDVQSECLIFALEHDERFGVWGGKSERERRRLNRGTRPRRSRSKCGTTGGYQAHYRRGEKPCQPCRDAEKLARALRAGAA